MAEQLQGGKEASSALQTPSLTLMTALGLTAMVSQMLVCVHVEERGSSTFPQG